MLAYRKHRTHNTRAIEVMLTTYIVGNHRCDGKKEHCNS